MLVPEQINLYIAEHPEWQRKQLVRLRQLIHATCHDVQENWRAGAPAFDQAGKPVVTLSSTKTTVSACFPNGDQLKTTKLEFEPSSDTKCTRTVKFREGDRIPEAAFIDLLKKSLVCNAKTDATRKKDQGLLGLEAVLRKDPTAWANWESFPAVVRHEYIDWVEDGKKEETRKHRMARALELIRDGVVHEEATRKLRDA